MIQLQNHQRRLLYPRLSRIWFDSVFNYFIPECPTGWEEWDQFCYKFVRTDLVPMSGAKSACAQDGAYLLSVNSDLEHSFIVQQLDSHDPGQRKYVSLFLIVTRNWLFKFFKVCATLIGPIHWFPHVCQYWWTIIIV